MAMSTLLQAVSEHELHGLKRDPDSIRVLAGGQSFTTYFAASINYFLTGNAYPTNQDHALWSMLHGQESVACNSLENGEFGLVAPDRAGQLAQVLTGIDVAGVAARIDAADLDHLADEEELYDLELIEPGEASTTIAADIRNLIVFYEGVAAQRLGVVSYTS
jgi:hypothetical protein